MRIGDWTTQGKLVSITTQNYSEKNLSVINGVKTVRDTFKLWHFAHGGVSYFEPTPCSESEYTDSIRSEIRSCNDFFERRPQLLA